jgi:hypothetical protein
MTEVNVKNVLKTMTISVKYKNLRKSLFRLKLGTWLLCLATQVLPTDSKVEIDFIK